MEKGKDRKGRPVLTEAKAKSFLAKKRGKRVGPRVFAGLQGRPLIHMVFTIPQDLRARCADRAWWELRMLALRRWLWSAWGLDWALGSFHPTGDKDKGKRFVPHLDLLCVRKPAVAGSTGYYDKPAFDGLMALLRWQWGKILGYRSPVNVYYGYVNPRDRHHGARVQHRVQYNQRPFPGWSWWRGQAPRWWGNRPGRPMTCPHCQVEVPDDHEGDWCPSCGAWLADCCPKCGKPYRFLGVIQAPDLRKYDLTPVSAAVPSSSREADT